MIEKIFIVLVFIVLITMVFTISPASAEWIDWEAFFDAWYPPHGDIEFRGFEFGAGDMYDDGWDSGGEIWTDSSYYLQYQEAFLRFYKINGIDWDGPTGYYYWMFMSPIMPGESKTWSDLYLWSHDYTPPEGNRIQIYIRPQDEPWRPPDGYTLQLVLDYVPASANWDGPMEYMFDINAPELFYLPIIETDDPLSGTKLHFTVTAPVPEPSSIVTLTFGLLPIGIAEIRRRRRK